MPFDRWVFIVDRPVGQSRSLAIAPISRGRFVGYSPSGKASPHSAEGIDAGTTVPSHRLPGLIKDMHLMVIQGGAHAIPWTHAGQVNSALLDFQGT